MMSLPLINSRSSLSLPTQTATPTATASPATTSASRSTAISMNNSSLVSLSPQVLELKSQVMGSGLRMLEPAPLSKMDTAVPNADGRINVDDTDAAGLKRRADQIQASYGSITAVSNKLALGDLNDDLYRPLMTPVQRPSPSISGTGLNNFNQQSLLNLS